MQIVMHLFVRILFEIHEIPSLSEASHDEMHAATSARQRNLP